MKEIRPKLERWFDEFGLATRGLLLATKKKSFWIPFIITFIIFGTLLNLLSSGFASFSLIGQSIKTGNVFGALNIIKNAFLAIFGIKKEFSDWTLNFFLIILQSILISLVVLVAKHNKKEKNKKDALKKESNNSGLESSAIVAGLAVLGSGCPTCGTTLLAPLLGTLLSGASSSVRLAGGISLTLNIFAIVLAIFVFKKLGFETYAIIKSEQREKKKEKSHAEIC